MVSEGRFSMRKKRKRNSSGTVENKGTQATAEEVIDFCKKQLANYKVPRRVEFMDSLPSTLATNKIRKSALVEDLKSKIDREKLKTEG